MSSPLVLPPEVSWPECLHCGEPVTGHQQDCGKYYFFEGAGLLHSKCLRAATVIFDAAMVR